MSGRGRKRTYDRIRIRGHSAYWKEVYDVQPPMAFDSSINMLTIYASGIKEMSSKGFEIEELTEIILNHEILHDIINNQMDFIPVEIFQRHWPFFWGIDYLNGQWFTTLMQKMGYDTGNKSANYIRMKLEL